jgi:putative transposase
MAYVIMPTHIHLILGSTDGGRSISKFMHSLKGRIRETLQGKGKFWQDGFDDVILFSEEQFNVKLNYIHYNPVKAGLVNAPVDWIYSSYKNWNEGVAESSVQIDFDWMEP